MSDAITFTPDRATYWRAHLIMGVLLGAVAGLVLLAMGDPYPVIGPIGAGLAIAARAAFVASEALAEEWILTDTQLTGPMERYLPLANMTTARVLLGAVQVVMRDGNKHLIKYLADPAATDATIRAAIARHEGGPQDTGSQG